MSALDIVYKLTLSDVEYWIRGFNPAPDRPRQQHVMLRD